MARAVSDTDSASQRVWEVERILGDRAGAWQEGVTGQEIVGRTLHHSGRAEGRECLGLAGFPSWLQMHSHGGREW